MPSVQRLWTRRRSAEVLARAQLFGGSDNVKSPRLLDPDAAVQRLEARLGPLHARLRLGIEREHEAQAFVQGLTFLHLENMPLTQLMIEAALRATGLYWRGRANAQRWN